MKHFKAPSYLLLFEAGNNLSRCLHMLRNQANLRSGERGTINNVLKDWQDVMDVLTQPTQNMPEPPVPGTKPQPKTEEEPKGAAK